VRDEVFGERRGVGMIPFFSIRARTPSDDEGIEQRADDASA